MNVKNILVNHQAQNDDGWKLMIKVEIKVIKLWIMIGKLGQEFVEEN